MKRVPVADIGFVSRARCWRASRWSIALLVILLGCQPRSVDPPDLSTEFQVALDELRLEYGFPGATAAFVLADGQSGAAHSPKSLSAIVGACHASIPHCPLA